MVSGLYDINAKLQLRTRINLSSQLWILFLMLLISISPNSYGSAYTFLPRSRAKLKSSVDACLQLSPKGDCSDCPHGTIGEWDVSEIPDMNHMFSDAEMFRGGISKWDVSNVKDMSGMFHWAKSFNGDIAKWDVSRVTNMGHLFFLATSFNGDISKWDVSEVQSMHAMFSDSRAFNGDISQWDVSKVTGMDFMFWKAISFEHALCGPAWVCSKASKNNMFKGSPGSISRKVCSSIPVFSPKSKTALNNAVAALCVDKGDCSNVGGVGQHRHHEDDDTGPRAPIGGASIFSAAAAARSLLSRTGSFLSKPVPVLGEGGEGGGAVDLSLVDPAALINSVAQETHFFVGGARESERFNARWRAALRERFVARGIGGELEEWLATGRSNGRPLWLQVMALKPHTWFKVHAHPNIEFEQTLAGSLHEVRLQGDPPTRGPFLDTADSTTNKCGAEGPDLAALSSQRQRTGASPMEWEAGVVPAGEFITNAVGSVHQSFTKKDGALILLLWSGCHANIRPEKIPPHGAGGFDLLRPGAGWSN